MAAQLWIGFHRAFGFRSWSMGFNSTMASQFQHGFHFLTGFRTILMGFINEMASQIGYGLHLRYGFADLRWDSRLDWLRISGMGSTAEMAFASFK